MPGRPTNEPGNYLALGKQSGKDTEATTFYFLRHLDGSGIQPTEDVESIREGGDGQEVGLRYKTAVSMDGDLVANARPEWAGRILTYALGADSSQTPGYPTTVASGTAQDHIITPTSSIPYLTVEDLGADVAERVSNAQITGLAIEGEAGRPLKMTANLIGGGTPYRRNAAASALTPTRETSQPFFFPGASYVLDGAGNTKITKFAVNVARNLDTDIRTTQLFREDVVALNFDTDFAFTLKYEDSTFYDKMHYLAGTTISPDGLGLATGSLKIFFGFNLGGASERHLELNVPLLQYTAAQVNSLDPDGKTMYIDVAAMGLKGATHQVYARVQTASGGAF
jgi:hypothetical protein